MGVVRRSERTLTERSVRFEADALMPVAIETKNTFVHFQTKRDPLARRATCSGELITLRRGSDERRRAARGNTRAVTYQPKANVVVVQIPELSHLRRSSVLSASSACSSRRSSVGYDDTPTHDPSPLSFSSCPTPQMLPGGASPSFYSQGSLTPTNQYSPFSAFSAFSQYQPCSPASPVFCQQYCAQPMSPQMQSVAPMQSPQMQSVAPMQSPQMQSVAPMQMSPQMQSVAPMQMSPQMQSVAPPLSPPCSPRVPAQFTQGWQPLHEEKPKKKSKKSKVVLPAQENEWTLLLRHLPLDFTPDSLLDELEGFLQYIDFYYLPTNFETRKNLGYAFVNFCDKAAAARFKAFWEQSGIPELDDMPVQDARMQGQAANVESFRNSSVMAVLSEELKPRVFVNGVQQPFPQPAKKLPPVGQRFRPTVDQE